MFWLLKDIVGVELNTVRQLSKAYTNGSLNWERKAASFDGMILRFEV